MRDSDEVYEPEDMMKVSDILFFDHDRDRDPLKDSMPLDHVDESFVTNGVLSISTTSDAQYSDGGYDRSTGTTNEVAFDVMIVDTYNKTINAIRIGAGNNRQWSY